MEMDRRRPLYMLAFDHRSSFSRDLLGIAGTPAPADAARVADAKRVIYEGFELALDQGVPRAAAALLVDEQYGAAIARAARASGVALAMPVERSGQAEFEPEYGADFGRHIEEFDPAFAKVLVRYNPAGDSEANARQRARLRELSDWLRARGRRFLFELLVPAEPAQLGRVGGDPGRYDRELRPGLVVATIRALQTDGVEPDIWKVEGLDERADCERVVAQARDGGRDEVTCIVLGRGADADRVRGWLEVAASVPGFTGFAIGRTLWWDALVAHVAGEIDRGEAARRIAARYREMIAVYQVAHRSAAV
jgi:myo-inositol catabolism protein IolC